MAKQLILDANILMRAVLGTRVATLIRDHAAGVDLLTVDEAFEDVATYLPLGPLARERLKGRDEDDWPYVALALVLDCPIWKEDTDFFGCGVATWTTDRIELYLRN